MDQQREAIALKPFPDEGGPTVAVLGGGVAGMSAAHELIERGFRVAVFEKQSELCGGKARSLPVPVGGPSGNCPDVRGEQGYLPGEHGFRFFPRFYKHITDTMSRIPFGEGHVIDNLVETTRVQLSLYGKESIEVPARFPRDESDFEKILQDLMSDLPAEMGLETGELDFFVERLWQVYSSCDARREEIYETMGWWEFVDADNKSKGYQKFLAEGLTRSLVAANAHLANAHVEGDIGLALILDMITPGPSTDRVLNGPTNEVWLHPWLEHLQKSGVSYQFDRHIDRIVCSPNKGRPGGDIEAVYMSDTAGNTYVLEDADYYVAALPAEKMAMLLDDGILLADNSLAGIKVIGDSYVEWMNGIQFFLKEDVPLAHGHTIYLDSPWALTSISQQQFWPDHNLDDFGDGNVKGVISVDISNWHQPGNTTGKAAKHCTSDEIKTEVWEELKRSHSHDETPLTDDMLYCWFLDPDITREQFLRAVPEGVAPEADPPISENAEPLFVAYLNTWRLRPQAFTQISNFFLASDYVRTFTSVATMEAANEAARRAVNGIIQHSGHRASLCRLWNVTAPDFAFIFRLEDHYRYYRGLPWKGPSRLARTITEVVARGGRVTKVARRALTRS
ncbi:MAG TPA: FAD-dependent oxidoreductase [Acidimicrobiia bacterium]|nr:FAD-dependent oxidoreductase [Acidimicrobiia bacterium]